MYHSRSMSDELTLGEIRDRCSASGTQWNARSHAAYHGYSQASGIEMTSALLRCRHAELRAFRRSGGGGAPAGSPCSHCVHIVVVELLAPEQSGEGLALHGSCIVGHVARVGARDRTRRPPPSLVDDLFRIGERRVELARCQAQRDAGAVAGAEVERVVRGRLRAHAAGFAASLVPLNDDIVEARLSTNRGDCGSFHNRSAFVSLSVNSRLGAPSQYSHVISERLDAPRGSRSSPTHRRRGASGRGLS